MPQTKYLSTGEFAKIMNTTKETLFHYEEMGIFYPDHVGKNGYRYYSIHQTDSLDMIMMLRDFGVPLKEIKKSMEHADTAHLLDLYQNEIQSMGQKIQALEIKTLLAALPKRTIRISDTGTGGYCHYQRAENKDIILWSIQSAVPIKILKQNIAFFSKNTMTYKLLLAISWHFATPPWIFFKTSSNHLMISCSF